MAKNSRARRRSHLRHVAGGARRRDQRRLERVAVGTDRVDDRLLAGEVAVDRAGAEPGFADDVLHRRAMEALARDAGDGGVENLLAPRLPVRRLTFGMRRLAPGRCEPSRRDRTS
jgi:hypothetical protein